MTTDTAAPDPFAAQEEEFLDEDAFARNENRVQNEIVSIMTVAADEEYLSRRNIPFNDEDFKAAYPDGYPLLIIGIKGLDVTYGNWENEVKLIYIPQRGDKPENYGKRRGRNSQIHLTTEAFVKVFGLRPFGPNKVKLIGMKGDWGQYLGDFEQDDGNVIEYNWDLPKDRLPDDYDFEGTPRMIKSRASSGGGSPAAPVETLTEEEVKELILAVLVGRDAKDLDGANVAVRDIKNLPGDWYKAAASKDKGGVLGLAGDEPYGWIDREDDKVIVKE